MYHGNFRAQVNPSNLDSFAICDVCGELWNHSALQFQYDWAGTELINLGYMACPTCYDKPFEPRKVIILPPDPLPIQNPRPPAWASQGAGGGLQVIPFEWDTAGATWDSGLFWDTSVMTGVTEGFPYPWGYGY